MELVASAPLDGLGTAIMVQADTIHVIEQPVWTYLAGLLGLQRQTSGTAEVFLLDATEPSLDLVGVYDWDEQSPPMLRWMGDHAYGLSGRNLTVWRLVEVEGQGQ